MEGSSKAQIITPRAITPTNESNSKKKKTTTTTDNNENNSNTNNNKLKASGQSTSNLQSLNKPQPQMAAPTLKESPPKTSMLSQNEIFGDDLNLSDDGSDMD